MMIHYDIRKLQQILEDYTRLTGLSIAVTDRDYRQIAVSHSDNTDFCRCIQESVPGREKCRCSDAELLTRCAQSRQAEFHICHAGLTDAAVPIVKDGVIMGYVILGRIRRTENPGTEFHCPEWMNGNEERMNRHFQKLVCYDENHIQSAIRLAVAITTYILVDDMVKMEYNHLMEDAVACVEQNLNGDLSVNTLCQHLHVSRDALYRNFRLTLNMTVNEYICQRRMERAEQLLRETDQPLQVVAESCGMINYTYFLKRFKKHTGVTPLQYRKQYEHTGGA